MIASKSVEVNKMENEFLDVQNQYVAARRNLDELKIVKKWFVKNNRPIPAIFNHQLNQAEVQLQDFEQKLYSMMGYDFSEQFKIK
jgi:hypothetical protein